MVVIDTLARAMNGGNENSSEDMGALVANQDKIREQTGALVCWIHHSGKDQAKGARGHSSLRAAIDTEIEVVASADSARKAATVVKQRELKKGDVFGFTLKVVELGRNRHGELVETCVVEPASNDNTPNITRAKLTPSASLAMRLLTDAMDQSGIIPPPVSGMPLRGKVVSIDAWRSVYMLRADAAATVEARQTAFRRAVKDLLERSLVASIGGFVWFVKEEN